MKGKFFKKATAMLSTVAMLLTYADFSAIDFPVHAEDPEAPQQVPFDANHNGYIDSDAAYGWYEIDSAEDLYWLAERINSSQGILEEKYFLKNDITVNLNVLTESGELNSDKANSFKVWTPIGIDKSHNFWGTFDGNNNTIRGLYYNSEVKEELGLFGNCYNATIKNVTIADSYFKGKNHVGGICGWDVGSTIENCHNTGTVESGGVDGKEIGGICGRSDGAYESSNIINCHNSGVVKGDYEVGGICGYISGCCITNCYNDGEITCTHQDVGGICGSGKTAKEPTTIKNCYNTGKVNCIYNSDTAGNCNAGGIIGFFSLWNGMTDILNCEIENCYNTGKITGNISEWVGACCGRTDNLEIKNFYYLEMEDLSGVGSGDIGEVNRMTAEQFKTGEVCYLLNVGDEQAETPAFYQNIGKDISPVLDSTHHEVLYNDSQYYNVHEYDDFGFCKLCDDYEPAVLEEDTDDIDNDGNKTEPVCIISNAGKLYWFANKVNSGEHDLNAVLTDYISIGYKNDAVLDDYGMLYSDWQELFRKWTPIGSDVGHHCYSGTFDGKGFAIWGLFCNNTNDDSVGLFGNVTGGTIKNVDICESYFHSNGHAGSIAGAISEKSTIENCHVLCDADINGDYKYAGLICGWNCESTIKNCIASGYVTATGTQACAGGICGCNNNGLIENCCYSDSSGIFPDYYSNVQGSITAKGNQACAGGICGLNCYNGKITNCYNTRTVSCSDEGYAGGICGWNNENGEVSNCYNTGDISGDKSGGVCGLIEGYDPEYIQNCYFLKAEGLNGTGSGDTNAVINEMTDEQFASGEVCWLLNGGQSDTPVFYQNIGEDAFPLLDSTHHAVKHSETSYYNEHSYGNGICTVCDGYEPATDSDGDGYYEISNAGQLYWFADKVNNEHYGSANAVLTKNITVNSGVLDEDGELNEGDFRVWTPIGYYDYVNKKSYSYYGAFDGAGHTISGLYFNDSSANNVGLFGYVGTGGKIQDVTIADSFFCGKEKVGGVCGYSYCATIQKCSNTGTVTGTENVGGVCGYVYNRTIENCYNTGKVSGNSCIGGICGHNCEKNTIQNCYNTGAVSGDTNVGGICGKVDYTGSVSNAYNMVTNCYYLETEGVQGRGGGDDKEGSTEAKTAQQFASGEVCWLLNGGETQAETPVFYQNIGKDIIPVLDKTHNAVYKNTACDGVSDYYNSENKNQEHIFDENGFCTICGAFEDGMGARLAGHTLTLDGSIGVNFYMVLDKSVAEDENAYMHFTLPNGKTEDVNVSQAEKKNVNGMECYVFKCNVAAKEMTATIKAQMFSNGKQGTVYEYTVKEYADYLFANAYEDDGTTVKNQEYADAYALVESMVNYGAYSQIYFDYNTNALANAGRTDKVKEVTAENVNKPYDKTKNNLPDGVSLVSANLELESETVLNLLFTNTTDKELTFKTSDDVTLTQTMTDDGIKVTITNIAAQHLDEDVIVNVSVADDNGNYSVKYSPMNYCYSVLSNDRTDELKNVMRAFWLYNQQAKAYFQNN